MRNFKIDFNKIFKYVIIAYLAIFLVGGIFAAIFGVELDINFSGGTKISYAYEGSIAEKDIKAIVDEKIDTKYDLGMSTSLAGDTQTFEISLAGKNALSAEKQEELTKALVENFKDNTV